MEKQTKNLSQFVEGVACTGRPLVAAEFFRGLTHHQQAKAEGRVGSVIVIETLKRK